MEHLLTKKTFIKSILSFGFIFAIPLAIIIMSLYAIGYHLFYQELKEKDLSSIEFSVDTLLQEIQHCQLVTNQLLYKDQFHVFDLQKSPSEGLRLITTLNNYTALNPFIQDIYIHFYDDPYFYSSTSSLDTNTALRQLSSNYTPTTLLSKLYNLDHPVFLGESSATFENAVILALPLKTIQGTIGTAIFMLDKDLFYNTLYLEHTESLHLLDANLLEAQLTTLDLSDSLSLMPDYLLSQLQTLSTDTPLLYFSLNESIVYTYNLSPVVDNLIILGIGNYSEIYTPINLLNTLLLLSLILTAIITCICSYLLITKDDTPYDLVESTLTSLTSLSSNLQREVADTLPLQRHFLLNKLISGQVTDWTSFTQKANALDLQFNTNYYTVLMSFADLQHFKLDPHIIESISTLQGSQIDIYYHVQHPHPSVDVFLLGSSKPLNLSRLQLPYVKLYFGTSQTSILHLPKSYIHTHTALDMDVAQSQYLASLSDALTSYKDYFQHIQNALTNLEYNKIPRILLLILKTMESEDLPFILQKSLCLEVIILFNNYFDEYTKLQYDKLDLISLYKVTDYSVLKEVFINSTSEMLDILCTYKPAFHTQLSPSSIDEYIQTRLSDTHLCTRSIAEHFETTSRHLSSLFESVYHQSPDTYIIQQRMNKAKHLLAHTPYSVKVIQSLVGYSHISTFISDFKSTTNLTPGQYRYQNKKDASLT